MSTQLKDGTILNPIGKTVKLLRSGNEDSVYYFYTALTLADVAHITAWQNRLKRADLGKVGSHQARHTGSAWLYFDSVIPRSFGEQRSGGVFVAITSSPGLGPVMHSPTRMRCWSSIGASSI